MRGVPVELPPAAAARLSELQLQRDAALDAANAAAARLNNLPRDAPAGQREALARQRDEQQARQRALAGLLSRTNQWLMELPRGVTLELVPPPVIECKSGTDLSIAINNLQKEVAATRLELDATRRLPLPKAVQRDLIAAHVARMALAAKPAVSVLPDGTVRIGWREDLGVMAMLAWTLPDQLIDAFADALPVELPGALPQSERLKRVEGLEKALLDRERHEARLIELARASGIEILYRPEMGPRALLSITVVPAQVQVA